MKRRQFLQSTLAAAAAFATPRLNAAPTPRPLLRLGSQEGRIPGVTLREKVSNLEQWGACGLELGGNPSSRIAEIQAALRDTRVHVSALCWGSMKGALVAEDAATRRTGIDALKSTLDTAGILGARGVIFVPCFHKQSALAPAELDKILLDILPALGDHARQAGTRILLEPLNRDETYYLNRVEQAAALCRKLNHPGIGLMGDFYHMAKEETNDAAAFTAGAPWLHHVHLASRVRWLPGQDHFKDPQQAERSFVDGFRALQKLGYAGYCSLECGVAPGQNPQQAVPAAFDWLRRQWDQAAAS